MMMMMIVECVLGDSSDYDSDYNAYLLSVSLAWLVRSFPAQLNYYNLY